MLVIDWLSGVSRNDPWPDKLIIKKTIWETYSNGYINAFFFGKDAQHWLLADLAGIGEMIARRLHRPRRDRFTSRPVRPTFATPSPKSWVPITVIAFQDVSTVAAAKCSQTPISRTRSLDILVNNAGHWGEDFSTFPEMVGTKSRSQRQPLFF